MKENWTLDDVLALPEGEHDYFERKSGKLLEREDFRADLSKAISAMANSGGGSIIIGVDNDGAVAGVPKIRKGRTTTRDWMEQVVPGLVTPQLNRFRIHAVRIEGSSLDGDTQRVVLVVEIDESWVAPHQSEPNKIYYHRVGGHSVPAGHYYINALRERVSKPVLEAAMLSFRPVYAYEMGDDVVIQLVATFRITNAGRAAAQNFFVDVWPGKPVRNSSHVISLSGPVLGQPEINEAGVNARTGPLLPGLSCEYHRAVWIRTNKLWFSQSAGTPTLAALHFSAVSEAAREEPHSVPLPKLIEAVTPPNVLNVLPRQVSTSEFYLGHGLYCSDVLCGLPNDTRDYVHVRGIIANNSERNLRELRCILAIVNSNGDTECTATIDIDFLAKKSRREFTETIRGEAMQFFQWPKREFPDRDLIWRPYSQLASLFQLRLMFLSDRHFLTAAK